MDEHFEWECLFDIIGSISLTVLMCVCICVYTSTHTPFYIIILGYVHWPEAAEANDMHILKLAYIIKLPFIKLAKICKLLQNWFSCRNNKFLNYRVTFSHSVIGYKAKVFHYCFYWNWFVNVVNTCWIFIGQLSYIYFFMSYLFMFLGYISLWNWSFKYIYMRVLKILPVIRLDRYFSVYHFWNIFAPCRIWNIYILSSTVAFIIGTISRFITWTTNFSGSAF